MGRVKDLLPEEREYPHVTVTQGSAGYFAVIMHWNTELDGFPEPWSTGDGRYVFKDHAIQEAKEIAEAEGIPYYGS